MRWSTVLAAIAGGLIAYGAGELLWVQRQTMLEERLWAGWVTDRLIVPVCAIGCGLLSVALINRRK
jgi:hypothetical protein